jgi:hypothetical protein
MRFNRQDFYGATFYYRANRAMQSIAGSEYWFAEFPHVNFSGLGFMYCLLEGFLTEIFAHMWVGRSLHM